MKGGSNLGITNAEQAAAAPYAAPDGGEPAEDTAAGLPEPESGAPYTPAPQETAVTYTEPGPAAAELTAEGFGDAVQVDMGDVVLQSAGRIVQMDVTVKNVCPGRRVALAAILTEVDANGNEYDRGMKAFTIPAHNGPGCRDVLVSCIRFVLPEDLNVSGTQDSPLCDARRLKARFIAHNIDTDYACCGANITL